MSSTFSAPGLSIPLENDSCGISVLAAALDERDSYTDQHCDRVSLLAHGLGGRDRGL